MDGVRQLMPASEVGRMDSMTRSYARVLILWAVVLVALFAFQQYFS